VGENVVAEFGRRERGRESGESTHLANEKSHIEVEKLGEKVESTSMRHATEGISTVSLLCTIEIQVQLT